MYDCVPLWLIFCTSAQKLLIKFAITSFRRVTNPHLLCVSCRSEECNIDDKFGDCYNWDDDIWQKVSSYNSKPAIRWEKKAKAASSFSFSGFSPSVPVPMCELTSSLENIVVTSVPSTVQCLALLILYLFRQNTYLQNKKHTLTCQRWDWLLQI